MMYDLIATIYDEVNKEIDYTAWAEFIERIVRKESVVTPELVLDLGCGTGKMTLELAERGYDMIGIDGSVEMLDVARDRFADAGMADKVLLLCQDMREFELYGTVELVVSCLDCVNHLTSPRDVKRCFSLVHNYLSPDGIFVFDINGKRKFETVYSDQVYVLETDGALCIWQNDYNEKTKLCDFYITLFNENENGTYDRYDEAERERMYTLSSIKRMLADSGMEFLGAYSDFNFSPADDDSERIYIVAKCKK